MEEKNFIYLDNNATTELDPQVAPLLQEKRPLNPSSTHFLGRKAQQLLQQARKDIAHYLQVFPEEIFFTSGGTESLNLLLQGFSPNSPPGKIVTTKIEHAAVLKALLEMEKKGYQISYVPIDPQGCVATEEVEKQLSSQVQLLVFSAVNTETGVKNPIKELSFLAQKRSLPLVVDGVGLLGKEPFQIYPGISAMAFSAHKFHGPKGIGFFYANSSYPFHSLLKGGEQEYHKRAGTENLNGILAMAKAIELLKDLPTTYLRVQKLRDLFEEKIFTSLPYVYRNGEGPRIANTSNLSFLGVEGETLLIQLDQHQILASHGSACSSHALEPSRVLLEMGLGLERARSALRFSLSRLTTQEEIEKAAQVVCELVIAFRSRQFV